MQEYNSCYIYEIGAEALRKWIPLLLDDSGVSSNTKTSLTGLLIQVGSATLSAVHERRQGKDMSTDFTFIAITVLAQVVVHMWCGQLLLKSQIKNYSIVFRFRNSVCASTETTTAI